MNSSRKNTRCGKCGKVDKAIYNWFVGKRSQKIPVDGIIIKEKALEFAKTFGVKIETFLNKEQTEGLKQSYLTDLFQVVN